MVKRPLISIILPVYNGEQYLEEAIESCLNQDYKNLELIIVNDCSTDESLSIADKYKKKDARIKIFLNEENLSLPVSLNVGHRHAKGDLVTWTSDDNILKPDFINSLYEAIIREDCDIIFSNYDIIWADGSLKRKHETGPLSNLIFGDVIGASFLYKMKVFKELNGYNKELFLVEDYHFFLKASLKFKFHHLEKNLYQYRIHQNSLTGKISRKKAYNKRFKEALENMFRDIGADLKMNEKTINLLVDLFCHKPISLNYYLKNKKIIEGDIQNYQNTIKSSNGISPLKFLDYSIRNNWYRNKNEHGLKNLIKVLVSQKSILLAEGYSRKTTMKLILKCLF